MITDWSIRSLARRLDEIVIFAVFAAYGVAAVIQVIRDYLLQTP
jgi:hypothetical protein